MYNPDVEYPFACYNIKDLVETDFPFFLVEGSLDNDSRKVPFKVFSEEKFCLFAKIEQGSFSLNFLIIAVSNFIA